MRPYRVTIRLSRSNRGGAAGDRVRLSPRQLQACAERPRSPGGNLTTGTVPAGRADTSPQPGNGCRCLWQGCDDPEKCPVDPPGSMSLVSVCLSLRGQAFGSRLYPGTPRSELLFSLGRLPENALVEDQVCDRLSKPGTFRLEAPRVVPFPWPAGPLAETADPGKALPSGPTPGPLSIPVWPCAMKDSAWRSLATIPSAGSIAPGACLNQVYAGSYFRRMS